MMTNIFAEVGECIVEEAWRGNKEERAKPKKKGAVGCSIRSVDSPWYAVCTMESGMVLNGSH